MKCLPFQFIDLCILLGCDYCDSIKGIGPKRAIDLVKQHKTIEDIVKNLDAKVVFVYSVEIYGSMLNFVSPTFLE